jgi:uncharacterized RDD family membrane protein YckC
VENSEQQTGQEVDPLELRYASFTVRAAARVIDLFVLFPISAGAAYFTLYQPNLSVVLLLALLDAAYKPVMESVYGWTVGKRILKLKVISQYDLGPIDFNQSLMRFLPWALVLCVTVFLNTRYFQDPNFVEIEDLETYLQFMQDHPLSQNFFVGIIQYLPLFSAMFVFSDPFRRALHDRLAKTYCVYDNEQFQ